MYCIAHRRVLPALQNRATAPATQAHLQSLVEMLKPSQTLGQTRLTLRSPVSAHLSDCRSVVQLSEHEP